MTDLHTEQRQAWIQAGAPAAAPVPLIYRRHPDGSPVMQYTHSKDMDENYLRRKFEQIKGQQ